jgi:hypothetical protein
MHSDIRARRLKVLVVHHDAVVLEDLCETLRAAQGTVLVDRASSFLPREMEASDYDAALIEVSGNETAFSDLGDRLAKLLRRVVWITDDFHPAPEAPTFRADLRQPFRTEDVTAALCAAGLFPTGDRAPQA